MSNPAEDPAVKQIHSKGILLLWCTMQGLPEFLQHQDYPMKFSKDWGAKFLICKEKQSSIEEN